MAGTLQVAKLWHAGFSFKQTLFKPQIYGVLGALVLLITIIGDFRCSLFFSIFFPLQTEIPCSPAESLGLRGFNMFLWDDG